MPKRKLETGEYRCRVRHHCGHYKLGKQNRKDDGHVTVGCDGVFEDGCREFVQTTDTQKVCFWKLYGIRRHAELKTTEKYKCNDCSGHNASCDKYKDPDSSSQHSLR